MLLTIACCVFFAGELCLGANVFAASDDEAKQLGRIEQKVDELLRRQNADGQDATAPRGSTSALQSDSNDVKSLYPLENWIVGRWVTGRNSDSFVIAKDGGLSVLDSGPALIFRPANDGNYEVIGIKRSGLFKCLYKINKLENSSIVLSLRIGSAHNCLSGQFLRALD